MAAAHCVMKRMLIPILRTAQARVFVEQPPECGRVSGVGGTHGLPNRLALLVVEFQRRNHKTIRPMFSTDDISMTDALISHRRTTSMKTTMRVHASALNDYELFIRGRPTNGRLTTIGFNHRFRFED